MMKSQKLGKNVSPGGLKSLGKVGGSHIRVGKQEIG